MTDFTKQIRDYLCIEAETLSKLDTDEISRALNELLRAQKEEKSVFIFGNGGSGSTASHFTGDFNKGVSEGLSKPFRFRCLNDNIPTLLAIANDFDYSEVFVYQLRGQVQKGDVVMAISGSGNSENVLKAVRYAKEQGAVIIGLTGYTGGALRELSDVRLHVPVGSMQVAEDVHLIFDHLMMAVLCEHLKGLSHLSSPSCGSPEGKCARKDEATA